MKKRILAVLLAAVMVTSMVACGNDAGNDTPSTGGDTTGGTTGGTNTDDTNTDDTNTDDTNTDDTQEPADEGYDFGGAVVRVNGGWFDRLRDDNSANADYISGWDVVNSVAAKYNVTIEYVTLDTTGYDVDEAILNSMLTGEAFSDIFYPDDAVFVSVRDYVAEITDTVDQLHIGSTYIEPGTFGGHVYGWAYDDIGSGYTMAYSRAYLENIGMTETPTDKFMAGEWSYEDAIEYFTELKAHLPEGVYAIAVHPWHWASMAPAANGVVSVDSDLNIYLADTAYTSALDFYNQLIDLGLAAPVSGEKNPDTGGISTDAPYGMGDMSRVGNDGMYVITNVEAWQQDYLQGDIGNWGVCPYPWNAELVSTSGDYTTLSDNYKIAQSRWGNIVVSKAEYRGAGAKDIPDIVLHMIARDIVFAGMDGREKIMTEEWEAEQAGTAYHNAGFSGGTPRNFSTPQDIEVYDWLHGRVLLDWGNSMQSNGLVLVNRNASYIIATKDDSRSTGESFKASGEANLAEFK